jgi:hypothetical protein
MQKEGAFLILLQCACVLYKRYMPIWNILVNLTLIFHVLVIYIKSLNEVFYTYTGCTLAVWISIAPSNSWLWSSVASTFFLSEWWARWKTWVWSTSQDFILISKHLVCHWEWVGRVNPINGILGISKVNIYYTCCVHKFQIIHVVQGCNFSNGLLWMKLKTTFVHSDLLVTL